jgi:predicted phosphodiesterase
MAIVDVDVWLATQMVLVLIIGDLHIPHRIHDLPSKFKKLLVPGKIQQILCTGNVCDKETYEYLRTISPDVNVVKGDYDEVRNVCPRACVISTHSLLELDIPVVYNRRPQSYQDWCHSWTPERSCRRLGLAQCDRTSNGCRRPHLWAHPHVMRAVATCAAWADLLRSFQAREHDNKFFVNPGSATGAWTGAFNGYVLYPFLQICLLTRTTATRPRPLRSWISRGLWLSPMYISL